jgi:lipopolysaccharide export system permease protein
VLLLASLISLADFAISETMVPIATREAKHLYQVQLQRRKIYGIFFNRRIWVRVPDGFMSADDYDGHEKMLHGITLYRVGHDYLLTSVEHAPAAAWNGRQWRPIDLTAFKLLPGGKVATTTPGPFRIDVNPADFNLLRTDPDEFSLWQLDSYIHSLRRKGLDPGGYFVDRDLKYAMPLACVIMAALGLALSLDPLPRSLSVGRSFTLAIAIGFGYWLMFGLTSSLGRSGLLAAWLAAWIPNLTFTILAASLFLFGEER